MLFYATTDASYTTTDASYTSMDACYATTDAVLYNINRYVPILFIIT